MFKKLPPKLPSSNVTTVTSNVPPTKSVTQTEYSKLACMVNNVTEVTPAIPPADGVTLTEELSCRGEDNDDILTSIQSNSCVVDKERFQEKLRKVSKSEHHLELAANVTTGPTRLITLMSKPIVLFLFYFSLGLFVGLVWFGLVGLVW